MVKAISGVQTVRFKNELERNITIKLGYANAKIYKAKDTRVPRYTALPCIACPVLQLAHAKLVFCGEHLVSTDGEHSQYCRPACYKAYGSSKEDTPACDYPGYEHTEMELVRHVSFVDCPGRAHSIACHQQESIRRLSHQVVACYVSCSV